MCFCLKNEKTTREKPGILFQSRDYQWTDKKGNAIGRILGTYLCYLSGVYGILAAATILGKLKYEEIIVYIAVFVIASILWGWLYVIRGSHLLIWFLAFGMTAAAVWFQREFLLGLWESVNQDKYVLSRLTRQQETVFTVGFMAWGALLLYELTFHIRCGILTVLGIVGAVGTQIYQKLPVPMYEIGFFLFYQSAAFLLHYQWAVGRRSRYAALRKSDPGHGLLLLEGAVALLLLAGSFLASSPLQPTLFQLPLDVEQSISKGLSDLFWNDAEDGTVNRGNLRGIDRERLRVTLPEQPEEAFYLKGFTGGEYTGDGWEEADESAFYASLAGSEDFQGYSTEDVTEFYEEYTYQTAEDLLGELEVVPHMVETEEIGGDHRYEPYLSRQTGQEERTYIFETYPQPWMDNMVYYTDIVTNGYSMLYSGTYAADIYEAYAADTYTRLPADGLSRLRSLCGSHPAETRDAITNQILALLRQNAEYTITPGEIPAGEDVAEYFLFDRKAGYCQHFATAAVLMYRMYGIPARYATGFIASPDSFTQAEDGTWNAVLNGGQAHAWAEIYVDYIGWVPVETTPPGSVIGTENVGYGPMEERTEAAAAETETAETPTEPETEATEPRPTEAASTEIREENQYGGEGASSLETYLMTLVKGVLILGGAAVLALAGIQGISVYRQRRLEKNRQSSASRLLWRMVEMMHLIGKLKEYRGDEEDFPHALAKEVSGVSEEEVRHLVGLAMQENFGKNAVPKQERKSAVSTYRKVARYVYAALGPIRRLYFGYVKVYD